jgi:hypothetical protein
VIIFVCVFHPEGTGALHHIFRDLLCFPEKGMITGVALSVEEDELLDAIQARWSVW